MTGLLLLAAFILGGVVWGRLLWLSDRVTPHSRKVAEPPVSSPPVELANRVAPAGTSSPGVPAAGSPTTNVKVEQLHAKDYLTFYGVLVQSPPTPGPNAFGTPGVYVNVRTPSGAQNTAWFRLGEWVEVEREEAAA